MKHNRIDRNDAGTTMIEIVIAAAVFTAGAVSLLGGLMTLTTHSKVADERARATNFSRSTFEDLRGRTIDEILAYDLPVDNPDLGTVNLPGIGAATATALAIIPNGQGGFSTFVLGVDDPAGVNVGNLPNPIEVRVVLTPVRQNYEGTYSERHYSSSTMVTY